VKEFNFFSFLVNFRVPLLLARGVDETLEVPPVMADFESAVLDFGLETSSRKV
jgi:hypothetical protein